MDDKIWKPEIIKKLQEKKIVTLAMLGPYDAGKTYVCNKLTNGKLHSGYDCWTNSIEIFFLEDKKTFFGIIDVPGS